jgi:uncharacterized protein (UPF0261 family)
MAKTIACIATLDTKGEEIEYIAQIVQNRGHKPLIIDTGILDEPRATADITRQEIAKAANTTLEEVVAIGDQGRCAAKMSTGLVTVMKNLLNSSTVDGVISIGGGMGTSISTKAMQALPAGFPKVMVSIKVGQIGAAPYAGTRDITLMPSICDIQGLNRLLRKILTNAAGSIVGMVEVGDLMEEIPEKPLVVMSENGATTKCGIKVRVSLSEKGYESVVFAGAGIGGLCQEEFIKENPAVGVIELNIYEVIGELLGAAARSGPNRMETAGERGIPQLITPGSADFVSFLGPETVPPHFRDRNLMVHNPQATLLRVNADEFKAAAKVIANKLNRAKGPVQILVPTQGFSSFDKKGQPFYDPDANTVLIESLRNHLKPSISVKNVDAHINDDKFADEVVQQFLQMLEEV